MREVGDKLNICVFEAHCFIPIASFTEIRPKICCKRNKKISYK